MGGLFDYLRELNMTSVAVRMLLAMVFGGVIGLERGRKGRAAGFRTYMLVCLGATLTMLLSQYEYYWVTHDWAALATEIGLRTDVSRFGAQVINGIGFLGAGTIIVTGQQEVKGMTTAAGLWATAAAGLALGVGFYWAAVLTTMFMLVAMTFLARIERRTKDGRLCEHIYLELRTVADIRTLIADTARWDREIEVVPPRSGCTGNAGVEINFPGQIPEDMIARLEELDYVLFVL